MSDKLMYQMKLRLEDLELINTSVNVKQHLEVTALTAPFLTMIYVSSTDSAVLVFWIITSSMLLWQTWTENRDIYVQLMNLYNKLRNLGHWHFLLLN